MPCHTGSGCLPWVQQRRDAVGGDIANMAPNQKDSSKFVVADRPDLFPCAACALPLFTTPMQLHSGIGWRSSYTCIAGSLATELDFSFIRSRTEYHGVRCGGHRRHRFDGWPTPTSCVTATAGLR